MALNQRYTTVWLWAAVMLVGVMIVSGCSGLKFKKSTASRASASVKKGPMPMYRDFRDVLIPKELKLKKKASFVYTASGQELGVLSFRGRVEIASLIKFFEVNMKKDNWSLVSTFKSPRTLLLFNKDSRWCVMNIKEKTFQTFVEIWVAPKMNDSAGLLKD